MKEYRLLRDKGLLLAQCVLRDLRDILPVYSLCAFLSQQTQQKLGNGRLSCARRADERHFSRRQNHEIKCIEDARCHYVNPKTVLL